jgi:predicted Zn finger-like uncharacterized protein
VIIECNSCHAKYQYDESRFEGKPSKKIRCAKCQAIFEIFNPSSSASGSTASSSAPTAAPPAAPRRDLDMTVTRSGRTPVVVEPEPEQESPQPPAQGDTPLRIPDGKRLSLAIIDGADAGSVHRVEKPRIVIGRSGADIVINDGEASRNHAALEIRDTLFMLEDLGSRNGTYVAGEKISGPVELTNQGEFQIGSTTLMLIVTDDA